MSEQQQTGGAPVAPRFHVGQLMIVPVTLANPYQDHKHPHEYQAGRRRVEALTAWRATGRAPIGYVVWACPWEGGASRVTPADVRWDTSGIPAPADARPNADARPKGMFDE